MHLPRHPFDRAALQTRYESERRSIELSRGIYARGKQFVVRDMYGETCAAAHCALVLERPDDEARDALRQFQDVAHAKYLMGTNVGVAITYVLDGVERHYTPEPKNYSLTDQGWITAWFAALATLDRPRISALEAFDLERIVAGSAVGGARYTLELALTLQRLFRTDGDTFGDLRRVEAALAAPDIDPRVRGYATDIVGGQVDLLGAALLREAPHFNRVLERVLGWHRDHYAREPENPEGLVSLPLTAICRLAQLHGISVEHSSDYLPRRLLDGSLDGGLDQRPPA